MALQTLAAAEHGHRGCRPRSSTAFGARSVCLGLTRCMAMLVVGQTRR